MPLENNIESEGSEPQEKMFTPIEEKALAMGWRPLDEFTGDPEDFIDAKDFVGRAPLYEKIEQQKNAIKSTQAALEALKQHYTHVEQNAFNKAMKEIKAQQTKAIGDGDVEMFNELEERKNDLEKEKQEFLEATEKIKTDAPQIHPELQSWINRNPWYMGQDTVHMRVFADKLGQRLASQVKAGEMTQADALKKIEAAVKEEFPNKFRNPNRDKPSTVEATGKSTPKGTTGTFKMTAEQEMVWKRLERSKVMTKEQYIADLKKMEK